MPDWEKVAEQVDALGASLAAEGEPKEEDQKVGEDASPAQSGAEAVEGELPPLDGEALEKLKVYAEAAIADSHDANGNLKAEFGGVTEAGQAALDEAKDLASGAQDRLDSAKGQVEEAQDQLKEALPEVEIEEEEPESPEEDEAAEEAPLPPPEDGEYESVDEDGRKLCVVYKGGQLNGPWKMFDAEGNLEASGTMKEGTLEGPFETYRNGILVSQVELVAGVPHGVMKMFNDEGKLSSEVTFDHGVKQGEMITYHPNGQKASVTVFKDDKKNGVMESFSEDGQLASRVNYKNDKLEGLSENFYTGGASGLLRSVNYTDDEPDGTETLYDVNGKVVSQSVYDHGQKVSSTPGAA